VSDDSPLELYPGDTVVLDSAETLQLPLNCLGLVTSKLSLVRQGIVQAPPGIIDFGYGHDRPRPLELVITNESTQKRLLRLGDRICRVTLLATAQPVASPYEEAGARRFEPYAPFRFRGSPTPQHVKDAEGYVDRSMYSLYEALEETSTRLDEKIKQVEEDRVSRRAIMLGMVALVVAALGILGTAIVGILQVLDL
jgi:hypothetical protein